MTYCTYVAYATGTTAKAVWRWLSVLVVVKESVIIAANMIVSNAMKSSARCVLRKAIVSKNVNTAINATVEDATKMMKKSLKFTTAFDAMLNVVMIVCFKNFDRKNCIAQNVSIGVWQ